MLAPSWYPDKRQLRQFAGFTMLAFGIIGFLVLRGTGSMTAASVLWSIGGLIFLVGVPFPHAIRPVYALLMGLTLPIGWVVSNLLLRLIFYGVFTPIGLFFRILGRDPLQLKRPQGDTFWRPYPRARDVASYYRQS